MDRRISRLAIGLALLAGALTLPTPAQAQPYANSTRRGVVIADALNVRTGPSTRYSAVTVVGRGQQVNVLGASGNWLRISVNSYVSSSSVRQSGGDVVVTAHRASLRAEPGGRVLSSLSRGRRLRHAGGWGRWVAVESIGYVSASYVDTRYGATSADPLDLHVRTIHGTPRYTNRGLYDDPVAPVDRYAAYSHYDQYSSYVSADYLTPQPYARQQPISGNYTLYSNGQRVRLNVVHNGGLTYRVTRRSFRGARTATEISGVGDYDPVRSELRVRFDGTIGASGVLRGYARESDATAAYRFAGRQVTEVLTNPGSQTHASGSKTGQAVFRTVTRSSYYGRESIFSADAERLAGRYVLYSTRRSGNRVAQRVTITIEPISQTRVRVRRQAHENGRYRSHSASGTVSGSTVRVRFLSHPRISGSMTLRVSGTGRMTSSYRTRINGRLTYVSESGWRHGYNRRTATIRSEQVWRNFR